MNKDYVSNDGGLWVKDESGKWYVRSCIVSGVNCHPVGYKYIDPDTGEETGWWKKRRLEKKRKQIAEQRRRLKQIEIKEKYLARVRQYVPTEEE